MDKFTPGSIVMVNRKEDTDDHCFLVILNSTDSYNDNAMRIPGGKSKGWIKVGELCHLALDQEGVEFTALSLTEYNGLILHQKNCNSIWAKQAFAV